MTAVDSIVMLRAFREPKKASESLAIIIEIPTKPMSVQSFCKRPR